MAKVPASWQIVKLDPNTLGAPLGHAMGWAFYEHPDYGDEFPILATRLDKIGPNGPIVYSTNDYDLPDYL